MFNNMSHTNTHSHRVDCKYSQISGFVYLLVCYVLFVTPSQSSAFCQSVIDSKHSKVFTLEYILNILQMFSRCFSFFLLLSLLILIAAKTGKHCMSHQAFCIIPISSVNLMKLQSVLLCPYQFFQYYIILLYTVSDWYSEYFDVPCHT